MNRSPIVIVCGFALLITAALLVVLREWRPAPLPELRGAQTSADVRVKAVDRKAELLEKGQVASASGAVAIVCGEDAATAGRYEARSLMETTRTTDKNNFGYGGQHARRFKNAARFRGEKQDVVSKCCFSCFKNRKPH